MTRCNSCNCKPKDGGKLIKSVKSDKDAEKYPARAWVTTWECKHGHANVTYGDKQLTDVKKI